jgi:hypothetical protein
VGGDGAKTMFRRGVAAHSMMSVYGEHGPAGLGAVHPRACLRRMLVSIPHQRNGRMASYLQT